MACPEIFYNLSGKFSHRARCLSQWVYRPNIAIIGSYHGGNLGDLSLGESVAGILAERKLRRRCGLQTIYNLNKWPSTSKAIVGGGAVAYEQSLVNLSRRYGSRPQDLMFLGVDFNDLSVVETHRSFLQEVFAITCRSEEQAKEVANCLGRQDVSAHPDLAFTLKTGDSRAMEATHGSAAQSVCGLNIPPLMFEHTDGKWSLGSSFSDEIIRSAPSANANIKSLAHAYVQFYREACRSLLAQGYALAHVPFAGEDDLFARYVLDGLPVHFHPYRRSLRSVVFTMRQQQLFLSGRFHSLVFSLREQIPCLAFCYSPKSGRLMHDLRIDGASVLDLDAIVDGLTEERMANFISNPVVFDSGKVKTITSDVRYTVDTLFDQWGI
jgi:hypothetical protein